MRYLALNWFAFCLKLSCRESGDGLNNSQQILNNKGFSFFDFIASMAILSILGYMMVPKYDFLRKSAIEAQAKVALADIHKLEKIHYIFAGYYTPCLRQIGYEPDERKLERYYSVGFDRDSLYGVNPIYGEEMNLVCNAENSQSGANIKSSDINYSANLAADSTTSPTNFKTHGRIKSLNGYNYFSSIGKYKNGSNFYFIGAIGVKPTNTLTRIFGGREKTDNIYDAWSMDSNGTLRHYSGSRQFHFRTAAAL